MSTLIIITATILGAATLMSLGIYFVNQQKETAKAVVLVKKK